MKAGASEDLKMAHVAARQEVRDLLIVLKLPGLEVRMPNIQSSSSKFDLTLVVEPRQAGLACVFEYSSDLFDEARIDRLAAWLHRRRSARARQI